jgi:serine/threonine-protein kinase
VHRDVKPANVLVAPDDHCYLTDFGLVKDLAATAGATQTGEVLGTLDYVAPERIQGRATGPWSDVYALGCVLFFALTGSVVFPLDAPESKLWAHVSEPPPSVAALRPSVPAALDAVVARALAKDPAERHESATAFAAAVRGATTAENGRLAPPLAALVEAARGSGEDRLVQAADRVSEQAQRLQDVADEGIESRLAEVRTQHVPGKAQLVEALALRLAAQRRARAGLDALHAGLESVLRDFDALGAAAVCDRLEQLADDLEAAR